MSKKVMALKLITGLDVIGQIEEREDSYFIKKAFLATVIIDRRGIALRALPATPKGDLLIENREIPKFLVLNTDEHPEYEKFFNNIICAEIGLEIPDDSADLKLIK